MDIFPYPTSDKCRLKRAPRILENPFGDGYSQGIGDGINTNMQTWTVDFPSLSPETMTAIDDFLGAKGGTEAFGWTPPHETVLRKWKCKTWEAAPDGLRTWGITGEFVEVPA